MPADVSETDRSYRRGAIMGLTMAEAFILIAFALLLLFAFWQWELQKEITAEVEAFKELPFDHQQIVVEAFENGALQAFVSHYQRDSRFSDMNPENWRFIDEDELRRLLDASSRLPEDIQRDLADLVENDLARDVLSQMRALEELVEAGNQIEDLLKSSEIAIQIEESGFSVAELLSTAQLIENLRDSGQTLESVIEVARTIEELQLAGETLGAISSRIAQEELKEAELVRSLHAELGDIVAEVGGTINDSGAIILPDTILFSSGSAEITRRLDRFLANACDPWLRVLKESDVEVSEVKIEGHASSEWSVSSTEQQAYLRNLDLSQRRSQAVLKKCLDFVADSNVAEWARSHLIAVGYSSVRPIVDSSGQENRDASRRVVFSITPNRENLLNDIEFDAQFGRYDRNLFGSWVDEDEDCLNTRHELLHSRSKTNTTLSEDGCRVIIGLWLDPFSSREFTRAGDIEVDHLVSLRWAWDHGASEWSEEMRRRFFNDPANLLLVDHILNNEKGDLGPTDWLPPEVSFRCEYLNRYNGIIQKYQLVISDAESVELNRLQLNACG